MNPSNSDNSEYVVRENTQDGLVHHTSSSIIRGPQDYYNHMRRDVERRAAARTAKYGGPLAGLLGFPITKGVQSPRTASAEESEKRAREGNDAEPGSKRSKVAHPLSQTLEMQRTADDMYDQYIARGGCGDETPKASLDMDVPMSAYIHGITDASELSWEDMRRDMAAIEQEQPIMVEQTSDVAATYAESRLEPLSTQNGEFILLAATRLCDPASTISKRLAFLAAAVLDPVSGKENMHYVLNILDARYAHFEKGLESLKEAHARFSNAGYWFADMAQRLKDTVQEVQRRQDLLKARLELLHKANE
jgi:hypothetical protein